MQRSVLIEFGPRLFTFKKEPVPITIYGGKRRLPGKRHKKGSICCHGRLHSLSE